MGAHLGAAQSPLWLIRPKLLTPLRYQNHAKIDLPGPRPKRLMFVFWEAKTLRNTIEQRYAAAAHFRPLLLPHSSTRTHTPQESRKDLRNVWYFRKAS